MPEFPTVPRRKQGMSAWQWLRNYLPEGRGLPEAEWQIRHRAVLVFIMAHAVGLPIFAMARGWPPAYAIGEGALIGVIGILAALPQFNRKLRMGLAALGCVTSSAVLVQFWGGVIEAHFHFFVVVALISLYQDWVPFLLAIAFVAVDHGLVGTLLPQWVYDHGDAVANPWGWAVIHAVFVLMECVALVVVWRANEQAREATDRILRSAGEAIMGIDAECCITFANPAALAMAGGTSKLIGQPLYLMLRGDDGRPLFAGPDVLRQNPGAFSVLAWLAGDGDKRVPVEVLCTPIEGHGHQEGAVVAMRDITDRIHAEEQRSESARQDSELAQLREVDSFKTRFMNMAAHELNTPLTPIKMQMHLLKEQSLTPSLEPHRRSIQMLDRNFDRLSTLVHDLLDSTRLQSNRLPTAMRPTDLAPLLRETVESFSPLALQANIALDLNTANVLPCNADPQRMAQCFNNLLANALHFTAAGGRVDVVASVSPDEVRIAVRDTGVGLTAAQIDRLFKAFEQVHESQVATHHGSGLGLYITKGIVDQHGGRIWVESAGTGLGSTFFVTLPRLPAGQAVPDAPPDKLKPARPVAAA